jgi:uncharacterized surface protein with fasciclin (FAS1) repeats
MGRKHLVAAVGLTAALALPLAACSSNGSDGSSGSSSKPSAAATSKKAAQPASKPFGAACSKIPTDPSNPGSTTAMAKVPVATAASGNPLLSTLVSLVKKENLVDTLNGAPNLTVFAPVNDAFTKIPKSTMSKLTDQQITSILKLHVIGQKLGPDQLAGSHKTLNGASVTVSGSGDSFTVKGPGNKTPANVVCGNVQTANATVYLVDTVLMPAMS